MKFRIDLEKIEKAAFYERDLSAAYLDYADGLEKEARRRILFPDSPLPDSVDQADSGLEKKTVQLEESAEKAVESADRLERLLEEALACEERISAMFSGMEGI